MFVKFKSNERCNYYVTATNYVVNKTMEKTKYSCCESLIMLFMSVNSCITI